MQRYDRLNNELQVLASKEPVLSASEKATVIDYFNLCAEEYLFYTKGYVPEDVWHAWRRGMDWYGRSVQFVRVWDEEKPSDSYYGFDFMSRL